MAAVARHALRRVSVWTTSLGNPCRKSSLNSSPTLLVDASDEDVFNFQIFLESVLRAFAAEAGLLHAAEGRDLGGDDADVGADDAGLHLFRHAEDAADVAAVEIAGQAELRVVGELDDFLLALEADQRRHRA